MRSIARFSSTLLVGASIALAACGGGKDAGTTTQASGGEAAATPGAAAAPADSAMKVDSGVATAAGATANPMPNVAAMSAEEQLSLLGASNAGEIATSKAALPKLTNSEARAYAQEMVSSHQKQQGMADQMAKAAKLTPEAARPSDGKTDMANQMAQQLAAMPKGKDLDLQYMRGQVQAHTQTLDQLKMLQNSSDSTVKKLATQATPEVQAHLDRAQRILQNLGGGAGSQ
jgi:predicted outer membrane protein